MLRKNLLLSLNICTQLVEQHHDQHHEQHHNQHHDEEDGDDDLESVIELVHPSPLPVVRLNSPSPSVLPVAAQAVWPEHCQDDHHDCFNGDDIDHIDHDTVISDIFQL